MSLELSIRDVEGIKVVDLKGRLTVGEPASLLRQTVAALMPNGIILNLSEVDYVDSSGLGAMVLAHSQAEEEGGALKLTGLTSRSIELLVLTKLETVFETFVEERDAVDSFFPNREIKHFDILDFVRRKRQEGKS
jgi:anti-sigma B factor antagonist